MAAGAPRDAAPVPRAAAAAQRPALTVRGETLHWTKAPGASRYVVATTRRGSPTTYRVVRATSFTPQRRAGQMVSYRVRANVRRARWSKSVSITYVRTRARRTNVGAPPVLTVSHGTLSWRLPPGVSSFKGAISTVAAGGQTTYHDLGTRTTWKPPAQPGRTLYYSVASESTAGERWAPRIPITWPLSASDGASVAARDGKLKVGVMDIGNYNYSPFNSAQVFSNAGVAYTREDVGGGANTGTCDSTDYVCTALRYQVTPIVLFEGYADSNMTSEIVSLAQQLGKLSQTYPIMNKMHVIEFGNEVYAGTSGPREDGSTYGRQYAAAHAALAAAALSSWKLLAIGAAYCSYGAQDWIPQVVAAAGAAGIDGWTVHPYGPMNNDQGSCPPGQGFGWPEVLDYHNTAVKLGSTAPWYVTEVGQCLGGSGCNTGIPMGSATDMPGSAGSAPYFTQAADMRRYLTDAGGDVRTGAAAKYPWIAALIWYQAYDDGSGWFGLLSNGSNLSQPVNYERPAFTVLKQWISANGEG